MRSHSALTLIELVVVLSIMAALSGVMVPLFSGTIQNANTVTTHRSLNHVRQSIVEYWRDTKHVTLDGVTSVATETNRFDIRWLFANPVTDDRTWDFSINSRIGWRGPYLSVSTGDQVASGSPFVVDAWNHAIVIQDVDPWATLRDVRVVSAGPDGVVTIPESTATESLTANNVGDDCYVALTLR